MYAVVQNKNHVTIFKLHSPAPFLGLRIEIYKTKEDFEKGINGEIRLLRRNTSGVQTPGGKYTITQAAYGIRILNPEFSIILDNNSEKETLEEKKKEAVLAEFNSGIVVPYSDLFKFSVEVVNANNGETIDILEGSYGNTWMVRSSGVYIPSSGVLAGKPCMRLTHSTITDIIPKENKETGSNNQSVRLDSQRPYTVFISGLQVPHLEYNINSLFIDSEDYSKTYYYTFT